MGGGAVGSGEEGCGRGRVRGWRVGVCGWSDRGEGGREGGGVGGGRGGGGGGSGGPGAGGPGVVGTVLEKNGAVQVGAVRVGAARLEAARVKAVWGEGGPGGGGPGGGGPEWGRSGWGQSGWGRSECGGPRWGWSGWRRSRWGWSVWARSVWGRSGVGPVREKKLAVCVGPVRVEAVQVGAVRALFFPFPTLFYNFFEAFQVFSWTCVGGLGVLISQNCAKHTSLESPNVCFAQFWEIKTPKPPTQVHEKTCKASKNCKKGRERKKKREILDGPAEGGPAEGGPGQEGPAEGSSVQGVGGKVVQGRAVRGRRVQGWGVQGRCYRLKKRGLKNKSGLNNMWSGLKKKHLASMATGLKNEA